METDPTNDPVTVALQRARLAISQKPRDVVNSVLPTKSEPDPQFPKDPDALEAMAEPFASAHALRALALLDPGEAAPLALTITERLLEKANEERFAHLRAANPQVVEKCIRESSERVRTAKHPVGPEYLIEHPWLREAADVESFIAFFAGHHDQRRWSVLWSFVGLVAQKATPAGMDMMAAIPWERGIQRGISRFEEELLNHARWALGPCAGVLAFEDVERLIGGGILGAQPGYEEVLVGRPELARPEVCMRLVESLLDFDDIGGGHFTTDRGLAASLIERIGNERYVPACPLLAILLVGTVGKVPDAATRALIQIGGDAARAPLMAAIERLISGRWLPFDSHHPKKAIRSALATLIAIDARDPFVALAPFFEPDRIATGAGASVAMEALALLAGRFVGQPHAVVALLEQPKAPDASLTSDTRWIGRLIALLSDRRLALPAKTALGIFDQTVVKQTLQQASGVTPARTRPSTAPAKTDYLARYQRGDVEEVWAELRALGPDATHSDVADDVRAVAEETMRRVVANITLLLPRLRKLSVPLFPKAKALQSPKATFAADLTKLETKLKTPLPAALRAFYAIVGALNFSFPIDGRKELTPPAPFGGVPLVARPMSVAAKSLLSELRGYTGIPKPLKPKLALYWACDPRQRLDTRATDDQPSYVRIDEPVADPIIEGTEDGTLVDVLRRSLDSGGFLGGNAPASLRSGFVRF